MNMKKKVGGEEEESGGEREQGEGQVENETTCNLERVRMRREGGMEDKKGKG